MWQDSGKNNRIKRNIIFYILLLLALILPTYWRRKWQPTPVFLPRESQGWGSPVGGHLWGRTELDTTEATWQQQQQQHTLP